jgi:endonuclease I/chitodextrinase
MKKIVLLSSLLLTFIASAQEPYYDDVDLTAEGLALKENLATKTIAAHTKILSYGWPALQATDVNPENSSEVLLIYGYSDSGKTSRTRGINQNGGGSTDWNREHVYAKSLGTPNLGTSGPGADGHHLRPSDVGFNSDRGSLKFVDGSGNAGKVSGGWYPGDEWKGDVARIMMYMYIHYGDQCKPSEVGIGNSSATPDDMIDLFLEWNAEDPVSNFERQRNTYHENTSNAYAQGNRNPFIDNAYLATRIWGGTPAIDSWGMYVSTDKEAPTVPTNVVLSNSTPSSIDVTWSASTDNVAVTKYEIYVDGTLNGNTPDTNYTISGLNANTTYAVTVLAKDIANNKSDQTTAVNGTTAIDNEAPTVPTNVVITNQTGTSFKANWTASTDNAAVVGYDVFVDGTYKATTVNTSYTVSNLTVSTTYAVTILAKDGADNKSALTTAVNALTTDGSALANELFFSEYVEGGSYKKAIEIANLTGNAINLSIYSIKRQSKGSWETPLTLSGTIAVDDVFVIINGSTTSQELINESDLSIPNTTPMTFNGDDRIGLFKNDILIDIIGDLDGTSNFAQDVTLRRIISVTSPNTTYTVSEWEILNKDTVDGIGIYNSATAGIDNSDFETFKMYPNPTNGNKIYFNLTKDVNVNIYNVLGKLVKTEKVDTKNNSIDISNLVKGVYLLKIASQNQIITKKLIKK